MKNFINKLNIALVGTLVLSGFVAAVPQAQAAVAFNTFPIRYQPTLNFDLPMIDARNVTQGGSLSIDQADHDNGIAANAGDTIEFQIYYHNSGVTEDVATNVIIRAILPGGTRQTHEVEAIIDSDQTSPVSSADTFRGGNIRVNINGSAQTLEFISGSVRWFPNRSMSGQTPSNADSLVGSGLNIGSLNGCFEFSGFITFRARVGSQVVEDRGLSITKKVMNVTRGETTFRDSTTANPGDRVKFEIRFDLSGNASQNNVIVRDLLPSKLTRVDGSVREAGSSVSSTYESDLFGAGRNLGTLSAGTQKVITFEANVVDAGQFGGTTTLTNTANVRSDQVSTRQDDAEVIVQLVLGTSFSLRKTAFNLSQGVDATSRFANPGDLIVYTLYYRNTGQATISGAVIEDNIQDILELAEITNQGEAVSVNHSIRWAPVTVAPGVEIAKTFQVKVRDASLWPLASDLVMVNIYGNEVRVPVRRPQVLGGPPRTGAAEWLAASMASLTTFGFWLYRRRMKLA